jgi:uncharacterized membrane protein
MTKFKSKSRIEIVFSLSLLIAAAAAAYLLYIRQIGYTNDDWYLMYAAKVGGAGYFESLFSFDRPLRAFIFTPLYQVFAENAVLYNLSALALRIVSAFLLLWITRMLWPNQRKATLSMALLYLVYPGFLSQLNGIDYQPVMFSLVAAILSLGLSMRAFYEKRALQRWLLIGTAIVLGWLYVGLVEYEAAFEFLRLGILFVLVARRAGSLRERLMTTLKVWLPYALIPIAFVVWNLFLFESQRQATSLGSQFAILLNAPIQTSLSWLAQLLGDTVNVLFSAWTVPLYQVSSQVSASVLLIGVGLGLLIAGLYVFFLGYFPEDKSEDNENDWRVEAFWLGLSVAIVGLIPVIFANRQIVFPGLSRYSLVSSVGVAMLLLASLYYLSAANLRKFFMATLIVLAISTQNSYGALSAKETASIREFWWQVSWRVPQLETNTTLMINYSQVALAEEYFAWSPANLIYFPEKLYERDYLQPGAYAAIPNDTAVQKVLAGVRQEYDNRRTIRTYANYRNILILSQPSAGSCVQVIDGSQPEISPYESAEFVAMAPYSKTDNILLVELIKQPSEIVFGEEPAHGWCYVYAKASLARQAGDWQQVLEIADQSFAEGLFPGDPIEWMPFLEAYVRDGQAEGLEEISAEMGEAAYVRFQACTVLAGLPELNVDIQERIQTLFCSEDN